MVDIAMCNGRDCKKKETCYRYLAFPAEYQTFLVIPETDTSKCEHFWRCRNPKELREMNILNGGKLDGYI
jgi:hypothetical protein